MIYVDTSFDPIRHRSRQPFPQQSAAEVLVGVLANEGADLSATRLSSSPSAG